MYNTENAERIEKIFKDMLEFPLHQLNISDFDRFFRRINVRRLKARAYISYGGVLFLLWYLPDSGNYESFERGERETIRNELLQELFKAMEMTKDSSDIVKEFMSLTVNDYLAHISSGISERTEEQIKSAIAYYKDKILCCPEFDLSENITLSDLENQVESITAPSDNCGEDHKKAVHTCKEDLYYFLIKYVRKKYHVIFDAVTQCG